MQPTVRPPVAGTVRLGPIRAVLDRRHRLGSLPSHRWQLAHVDPTGSGEAVVVRRMIRYVDGEPWSVQDSSYPMDIAQQAGLLVPRDLPRGTVRAMAEHGHVEIGYRDEITTRMPIPDEAQTLDLAAGVPVLAYVRTCYTKERPVRLTETIFAGDRNRLVYELGDLDALYERDE
ncbi:MAG TPA: UTRA domain-containing protein [Actinomycetota bacterium]